jgi:uncharacterized protein (TIRG00374 family)
LELLIFYLAIDIYIVFFLVARLFFYTMPHVFGGLLVGGLIIYLVFGTVILLLAKKRSFDFLMRKFNKIKFVKRYFERIEQQLQHPIRPDEKIALLPFIREHKKIVGKIIFLQLFSIALDALTILLLFYGLGVPISLFIAVLVLVCTKIVSILPVSPGALILFESSMVFLFNSLAVPLGTSIIVTLIFRLLSFWLPIPAGYLLYRRWQQTNTEV